MVRGVNSWCMLVIIVLMDSVVNYLLFSPQTPKSSSVWAFITESNGPLVHYSFEASNGLQLYTKKYYVSIFLVCYTTEDLKYEPPIGRVGGNNKISGLQVLICYQTGSHMGNSM